MSISHLISYIVHLRPTMMAGSLSDRVISTTTMATRYASRIAWLGIVGLWLFLDLSIVIPDVRAQASCDYTDPADITCSTTTSGAVTIDTNIDTTVTVDSLVTVDNTGIVIDFNGGDSTRVNTVNNNGEINRASGRAINGGSGKETINNNGKITNNVLLNNGDDTFINESGAEVTGLVRLGIGNDMMTNDGKITINIEGESGNDTFTNSGTINGNLLAGTGNDIISLNTGSSIDGDLDGQGGTDTLRLLGNGTINHSVSGIEILDSQGDWTLDVDLVLENATLSSGTLTLATGRTLTLQNALTAIDMDIDPTLIVDSGATLEKAGPGAVIDLSASDQSNTVTNNGMMTGDLLGGTGNDVITNSGSLTGTLSTLAGDDTIFLDTSSSITGSLDGGTGTDSLTLLGSGILDHSVSGIEILDSQGDWTLDVDLVLENATLSSGTLTLATGRTLTLQNALTAIDMDIDPTLIVDSGATLEKAGPGAVIDLSASDQSNTVTNNGMMTGDLLGGTGNDVITNSGSLTGTLSTLAGDDTIFLDTSSSITGSLDGGTGTDSLTLLGSGILDHSVSGIEILDSQGDWTLDVDLVLENATLSSGTLTLATGRTLTLQNALTAIDMDIDPTLIVDSGATLEKAGPGAVIDLSASDQSNTVTNNGMMTGDLLGGTGNDVITNSGSLTGTLSTLAGDDTIFLDTSSSITGSLDGGTGTDSLTLLGSGILDHSVSGIEILDSQGDWTLDVDLVLENATLSSGTLTLATGRTLTLQNALTAIDMDIDPTLIVDSGATLEKAGPGAVIDLSASDQSNTVTNNGMMTGDLLGGTGNDVITNSGSLTGTLNTGNGMNTVINSGTMTGSVLGGSGNDQITNTGTVGGDLYTGNGTNTVTNSGTITSSLLGGSGDDTIFLNTGSSITGMLDGSSGTDSLTLLGNGTINHSIDNIETLDSQGDWTLNTATNFVNGATINSGTLTLENTLTAETVIESGATLMGNGMIIGTLTNNGRLSPGNSIGTITITGDYVQNPGTTLEIEVSPTNGVSDQLVITGGTAQLLGGTLSIIPLGDIASSNEYTFLTADGGITGTFDDIVNTSAFSFDLDFSDPTAVRLISVSADFLANALTPNQRATGTYLDQIFSTATPELEENLATLGAIPDTTAYQAALDQLNPEFFDAFTGKTFLENYWFNSALGTRRNQCWRQGPEQAPQLRSCGHRFATWSQIDGSTIGRSGGSNHISYDAEVYNLAMGGFWAPANGRTSLQAALGYSHDQLSIIGRGTGSSHRATVGLQGRHYVGPFALAGLVTGGYKWSESTRTITYSTVNQAATASFNSLIASADIRLEYEAFNTQGWYGLTYGGVGTDHMTTYSFSESYAEGLGLDVDSFEATRYGLVAGGSVKRAFPFLSGGFLVPEISLSYMAFLDGNDRTITGRLSGAESLGPTLTATGQGPDERLRLGAWLTTQQSPALDLSVGFQGSFLDGTQTLGGALQLVYRFNE